jgi:hypothetical protein
MPRYASKTEVSSSKSKDEIERILARYGAGAFAYATDNESNQAAITFKLKNRYYRMMVPLPNRNSREFTHTPDRGVLRSLDSQERAYEQAVRQRWRAVALLIKAVLEAVESGIKTAEEILLSFTLLPDDRTVGDWINPQLEKVYLEGRMPPLIPYFGKEEKS